MDSGPMALRLLRKMPHHTLYLVLIAIKPASCGMQKREQFVYLYRYADIPWTANHPSTKYRWPCLTADIYT